MIEEKIDNKLSILIDAENAQPSIVEGLFDEIAKYGIASVKRIYGDWTAPQLNSWKGTLLDHSIQPIQQFSYTTGKNATDSALIIDAMDLLHNEKLDGFCIVSSDSDFTRLCQRIRESGLTVYGFGEKKTPKPFISACDKFIYTENLRKKEEEDVNVSDSSNSKRDGTNKLKGDSKLVNLLRSAVEDSADDNGWASLGNVGQNIIKRATDFDSRTYGYKKLGDLVEAIKLFEIDKRSSDNSGNNFQTYVKDNRSKNKHK